MHIQNKTRSDLLDNMASLEQMAQAAFSPRRVVRDYFPRLLADNEFLYWNEALKHGIRAGFSIVKEDKVTDNQFPFHYLCKLIVDPKHQNNGVGSGLLAASMEKAIKQGVPLVARTNPDYNGDGLYKATAMAKGVGYDMFSLAGFQYHVINATPVQFGALKQQGGSLNYAKTVV